VVDRTGPAALTRRQHAVGDVVGRLCPDPVSQFGIPAVRTFLHHLCNCSAASRESERDEYRFTCSDPERRCELITSTTRRNARVQ
jgi:hypothetical protein